mgnify:CR=1 FL=1
MAGSIKALGQVALAPQLPAILLRGGRKNLAGPAAVVDDDNGDGVDGGDDEDDDDDDEDNDDDDGLFEGRLRCRWWSKLTRKLSCKC